MTIALPIAIAVAAILGLLGVMAIVRHLAARREWSAEVQRKIIHVCTGIFAMTLPWLFAEDWPVYMMIGLTLIVMTVLRLPSLRTGGLGATLHTVERKSWGDFLLAIAVGLVFLFSQGSAILYILPLAIVTLADAAAALAGSIYGRRFFQVEDGQKSVEGSTVFFLVTTLLVMICLLLFSDVARPNVVVLGLMIAGFATLVEADSWRGFDNLFLPLGVFFFLAENLYATPMSLAGQASLFIGALVLFRICAPSLGLSRHAARVYVIAVFLLMSVTAPQNGVLPVMMLATHIWSRICNPSEESFPDLEIIAVLAILSFGSQALGQMMGANALSFFTLSAAAIAAGLASLAVAGRPVLSATTIRLTMIGILFLTWWAMSTYNPPIVHWHGIIWPAALALIAAITFITALRPQAFAAERSLKLALVSILPAIGLYLLLYMTGPLA